MKQLSNYIPIIGLEVHVELRTKSKMFCGCSAKHFLEKPNIHTCPVCLGLPGALPVPNKKAIEWCLLIGLALNCKIADQAKFDRKNYFYPDLPKGYQISQYDMPFARHGELKLKIKKGDSFGMEKLKIIRINRVHMEEDTGKLIHTVVDGEKVTLIDFNRSGVPLVEIVSEPDINSSEEAVAYLKKLQQIIRYLEVSDCDMEKGSMRLEVNISLLPCHPERSEGSSVKTRKKYKNNYASLDSSPAQWRAQNDKVLPPYKVEIKNINSFRFVDRAINYEIQRQKEILESGKTPVQETRGFNEKTGKTYSQRTKEEAQDYRYFPEPDIPPIINLKSQIAKLKAELPELPDAKIERLIKQYGISEYNANILTQDRNVANYFEEVIRVLKEIDISALRTQVRYVDLVRKVASVIVNKRVDIDKYLPAELVKMLVKRESQQIMDEGQIKRAVDKVLDKNKKAVNDYKKGKREVIGFLIGQVMKLTKGKGNAVVIKKMISKTL